MISREKAAVVVTRRLPDEVLNRIDEVAGLRLWEGDTPIPYETLMEWVQGCAGILTLITDRVDGIVLDSAGESLKVVSQMAVGYDNIDVGACTARGIPLGHTPGVLTDTTADLAIALMLATARRLIEAAEFVKQDRWETWRPMELVGRDVGGSIVGIIGLGRIGKAVARRLQGFKCRVLYSQRQADTEETFGAEYVDLQTLLWESDFVTIHCPLNEVTKGLISAETLRLMKPTAILINTARGGIVDQEALIEALREGVIAAAGLDVTTPEPIRADHPLLALPNVVVLPHIGSASIATRMRMAHMAVDNLLAGLRGERLPYCANPQVYEQKESTEG